jgi:hypothetical protein
MVITIARLLAVATAIVVTAGALVWAAKYGQEKRWEGYYQSIELGEQCVERAKREVTAMARLDEAMRCTDLHPGTIYPKTILDLQHEVIRELAQAK